MKYINKRLKQFIAEVKGDSAQIKFISNGNEVTNAFPCELIIDSPDWILQPDFQITAFRQIDGLMCRINNIGLYDWDGDSSKNETFESRMNYVKSGGLEIYSVKYKDQEFKIGDKTNFGVIDKFEIVDTEMRVYVEVKIYGIGKLTHSPKAILTNSAGKEFEISNLITYLQNSVLADDIKETLEIKVKSFFKIK